MVTKNNYYLSDNNNLKLTIVTKDVQRRIKLVNRCHLFTNVREFIYFIRRCRTILRKLRTLRK